MRSLSFLALFGALRLARFITFGPQSVDTVAAIGNLELGVAAVETVIEKCAARGRRVQHDATSATWGRASRNGITPRPLSSAALRYSCLVQVRN